MIVLASPGPEGHRDDNPYLRLLYDAVRVADPDVTVLTYDRRRLLQRPDVIHVHWPEFLIRWRSLRTVVPDLVKVILAFEVARSRGARVVWTGHDLQPHDVARSWLWWFFRRWFLRRVDLVIVLTGATGERLTATYPVLRATPMRLVPHGHYRTEYPPPPPRALARRALGLSEDALVVLAFGQMRRYKRVVELMREFTRTNLGVEARLLVAGEARDPELAAELEAAQAPGITLDLSKVATDDVPTYFAAADVAVMAYSDASALNSGVALLALSMGTPVVMSASSNGEELQKIAGYEWVTLVEDTSVTAFLDHAVRVARRRPTGTPDLSALDWPRLGEDTVAAYRASAPAPGRPRFRFRRAARRAHPPG